MSLLFRLFGVCLHFGEKLFFGRAFVGDLFAAKGVVFLMTGLALGAFGRACGFVVHGCSPVCKASN